MSIRHLKVYWNFTKYENLSIVRSFENLKFRWKYSLKRCILCKSSNIPFVFFLGRNSMLRNYKIYRKIHSFEIMVALWSIWMSSRWIILKKFVKFSVWWLNCYFWKFFLRENTLIKYFLNWSWCFRLRIP